MWSAQARSGSAPLVLGDLVVIATDSGVSGLGADGEEQWETDIELLANSSTPEGSRTLTAVTQDVVAVIDKGTLPEGSDPLATDDEGVQVTLVSVEDGTVIATEALAGEVKTSFGLGFEVTANGSTEHVAFTPSGEKVLTQDGSLPIATVGEHIIWATPYNGNMGTQGMKINDVPLTNATLGASDGREIVVLRSYDGMAETSMWFNLATGTPLTPDASCPASLVPKTLTASADGAFVVGDNAIADVAAGTITCTGGEDQKPVLWRAVTNDGTAYGQTADANDTFLIGHGGEVIAYTIPSEAALTTLAGFTDDDATAILFNRDTGIVNANPVEVAD